MRTSCRSLHAALLAATLSVWPVLSDILNAWKLLDRASSCPCR